MFADVELAVKHGCLALGWFGEVVGPVTFGGVRFWASVAIDQDEHQRRQDAGVTAVTERAVLACELASKERGLQLPLLLEGCLVASAKAEAALRDASLLSGYSGRAVLVPDGVDVLGVCADAALLDQGVVVFGGGTVTRLATAGPRVGSGGAVQAREWELLETVYAAYLAALLASV